MSYAEEKISLALRDILTGKGDSRYRLADAFTSHLSKLEKEDFCNESWKLFKKIKSRVEKHGPLTTPVLHGKIKIIRGTYENSVSHIRCKTASRLIEGLIDVYLIVSKKSEWLS